MQPPELRKLAARLDGSDHGRPAMLGVIVPSGYGSAGKADVGVIPIGALGP